MKRKAEKNGLKFNKVVEKKTTVFHGFKFDKYKFIAVDVFNNEYYFIYSEMQIDKRRWYII